MVSQQTGGKKKTFTITEMTRRESLRLGLLALLAVASPVPVIFTQQKKPTTVFYILKVSPSFLNDPKIFNTWLTQQKIKIGDVTEYQIGWINDDIVNDLLTIRFKIQK